MGKKAELDIKEDYEALKKLLKNQSSLHKSKRVEALLRIKNKRDLTRQDLANYLGVHIRTLERWVSLYLEGGIESLLRSLPRNKGSKLITKEIHKGLSKRVHDPNLGFRGYWDAHQWVESTYGVKVQYARVRGYLIQHFGTKLKTPRKSHTKKSEAAVAVFKKPE